MAEPIHDWLAEHGAATLETLGQARTIMVSGGLDPKAIAALAKARIDDAATPADQTPTWFALWVDSDPGAAMPELEARLGSMTAPEDARFAARFVVSLLGGRSLTGSPTLGGWREPAHLKALNRAIHRHIRVSEDIDRANGGVFSPGLRDDAQEARSTLFSRLAEVPGEEYRELLDFSAQQPDATWRAYMRRRAHGRAVQDSDTDYSLQDITALIGPASA